MKNGKHLGEVRRIEGEIASYEREVERGLSLQRRNGIEPSTNVTPLEIIFASEQSAKCPHCGGCIELPGELEKWGIQVETVRRIEQFVSQDGLHPGSILRNLYALFRHMSLPSFEALTVRQRALILGDSHGSEHLATLKVEKLLRRKGNLAFKAAGQKTVGSRATFSKCQQGNTNRRHQHRSRHRRLKAKQRKQTK